MVKIFNSWTSFFKGIFEHTYLQLAACSWSVDSTGWMLLLQSAVALSWCHYKLKHVQSVILFIYVFFVIEFHSHLMNAYSHTPKQQTIMLKHNYHRSSVGIFRHLVTQFDSSSKTM